MARHLVWIHRGPLADRIEDMSEEDAATAESEEWGQIIDGNVQSHHLKPVERGPHAAAEAWAGRRAEMAKQPQTYTTREVRADQPRTVEPEPEPQPEAEAETTTEQPEPEPDDGEPRVPRRRRRKG